MTFEQRLAIHPELAEHNKDAVERAIDFIERCCQGEHDHFNLLDRDPEMCQAFKVLVFGECHFPPSGKLGSGHLTDKAKHADEFCLRSFDTVTPQPSENKGALIASAGRRGRKRMTSWDGLIRDLAMCQDYGARKIATELERRGICVNVRMVSRRLREMRQLDLPEFE